MIDACLTSQHFVRIRYKQHHANTHRTASRYMLAINTNT
ncbi:UBP-type zinc finger domain-containing protein [Sodalis endosymbiont of Henestaris halophilus]|nr:UBP-type zinc finger domain-containing protein [Sodalis endosymbiont of Henestaris halophilus]